MAVVSIEIKEKPSRNADSEESLLPFHACLLYANPNGTKRHPDSTHPFLSPSTRHWTPFYTHNSITYAKLRRLCASFHPQRALSDLDFARASKGTSNIFLVQSMSASSCSKSAANIRAGQSWILRIKRKGLTCNRVCECARASAIGRVCVREEKIGCCGPTKKKNAMLSQVRAFSLRRMR